MSDYNKKSKKHSKASKGGESQPVVVNDNYANIQPVLAQPLEVKVYNNNFDKALKAFRALVQKERVLSTFKDKQVYEKPSQKRRRKRNERKRKMLELKNSNNEKDFRKED